MKSELEKQAERYAAAAHAMQSAVALSMNPSFGGGRDAEPKHLRVGVNSAMVETAALTRLLIAKGVFTAEEHMKELADEMEREVERYRAELNLPSNVTLA